MNITDRPRRLRKTQLLRDMTAETHISVNSLVYPLFVIDGENIKEEIGSMPGQHRWSIDRLGEILERVRNSGVRSVLLFGIPAQKDEQGSSAWAEDGIVQRALEYGKKNYPDILYITDVCMCEYTSHGHCGILDGDYVHNDKTLEVLARTAVSHAKAGADMVAPSDMMDGRIGCIRKALDSEGFENIPIMAYSAKYASAFYGPFRAAADSTPAFGDRRSYQMDCRNIREAVYETELDIKEGADIVMVKPALSYLDVAREIRTRFDKPLALYSVSGEYSMIKAGASLGYIDEERIVKETALSMFRAGADILITYYAPEIAGYIREGSI